MTRTTRPLDKGAAILQLHDLLRAGEISETTFRVGIEHVVLVDEHGRHQESLATIARLCSDAHRTMRETQVGRSNKALVRVGFMTMRRRQQPGNGAYTTHVYTLV